MTDTDFDAQKPMSNRQAVMKHVAGKLHGLNSGIAIGSSTSKANLAKLRRAVNTQPGATPEVWDITLGGLPAQVVGKTDDPSFGEIAVHNALALFAIHQQGKGEFMHKQDQKLGLAVRKFIYVNDAAGGFDNESPILRRFNALSTSDSVEELLWHLRSLVTQVRGSNIHIDFVDLAASLYDFHFPESRDRVRLNWGRQLYTAPRTSQADSTTPSTS